ncbi:MAG: PASTA domain-containing protein [Acidobacteria bacterium]|nr:PASTA domain-containing protein [Acidobacteriota bacterium]
MNESSTPTAKSIWIRVFRFAVIAFGVLGIMSVAGALSTWITIKKSISGHVIQVPDLCGLSIEDATRTIEPLGLTLSITQTPVHNNVVAKDNILFQRPNPGKHIKSGRQLVVTLSAGPELKLIPSLVGEPLNFAEILTAQADTEITKVSRTPSAVRKGRIMAQSPKPGEEIGIRHGMSVLISDGDEPKWYVAPDFRGRSFGEVKKFLDEHGFRVVAKFKDFQPGWGPVVLRQIPQPGYPIRAEQTINLEVNKD